MADKQLVDKQISDLTQAQQITGDDLFVLEQGGEAKKLKGSQVVQYAKDAVAKEVQGVKEYADTAKASADAAAASATKAATAAQGIDNKVAAADASAKAAAASAAAAASSATGVDEKVQAAQTAADNAAKSETAAKNAQTAAANAQKAAESAQTGAQSAKTAAESAQEVAESAKNAAADSSTAAGQKATQAAQSAEDAASAKSAAETAKTDAQAARDAIVNMIVEAVTLETGKPATVKKSLVDNVYKLVFGLPKGDTGAPGPRGATGNGISGIALKSGNHAPGTSDVYTITLTDGTTYDFAVYNGANGAGAGDMLASVYDPQGKHQDVFKYVDDAIGAIPTPDVSAQIKAHNESETAHPDIRGLIPTKTSQLDNDSGYLTQHQDISGKLDKTGDGSNVTAAFTAASTRANIATGEKLSVLFGKIAKWLGDLKALAFKDTVAKTDLDSAVQSLLLPDGGTTGQVVTKTADGQEWADAAGGDVFIIHATVGADKSVTPQESFDDIKSAYFAGKALLLDIGANLPVLIGETGSKQADGINIINFQNFKPNTYNKSALIGTMYMTSCVLSSGYFTQLSTQEYTRVPKPTKLRNGMLLRAIYDEEDEEGSAQWQAVIPSTTSPIKGDGAGGLAAAVAGSDYIASGNITKQTLVATETTPTENYAINWLYG